MEVKPYHKTRKKAQTTQPLLKSITKVIPVKQYLSIFYTGILRYKAVAFIVHIYIMVIASKFLPIKLDVSRKLNAPVDGKEHCSLLKLLNAAGPITRYNM